MMNDKDSLGGAELARRVEREGYTEDLRDALYASEDFEPPVWKPGNLGRIIHRYAGDDDITVVEDPRGELYVEDANQALERPLEGDTSFQTMKELLAEEGFYGEAGSAGDREPWITLMFFLEKQDYADTLAFVEESGLFEIPEYIDALQYDVAGFTLDFYEAEPDDETEQNLVQVDIRPAESDEYDLDTMLNTLELLFSPDELVRMKLRDDAIFQKISAGPDVFVNLEEHR